MKKEKDDLAQLRFLGGSDLVPRDFEFALRNCLLVSFLVVIVEFM